MDLDNLSDDQLKALLKKAKTLDTIKEHSKITDLIPYDKQKEFLYCKAKSKALLAGNQIGKTTCMMMEETHHATGIYPPDWAGIRYSNPVETWIIGPNHNKVRDAIQFDMLGKPGRQGTGLIPKDKIDSVIPKSGTPQAVDTVYIKHVSGGLSSIKFLSLQSEIEQFMSDTIDRVCFDEPPTKEILNECRIRLIVKDGHETFTMTPVGNNKAIAESIIENENTEKFHIAMDDAPWMTEEKIERILADCEPWEREARRYGRLIMGSTAIFKAKPEDYLCESFEIPRWWPRIGGLDIGGNHPTCAYALAWDRDSDCLYCYQEERITGNDANAPSVARKLRGWGIEFATSHDAFNKSFGMSSADGKRCVADVFKEEGLRVFNAGRDPWKRIELAKARMTSGQLWIFKDKCPHLVKGIGNYRTKDDMKTIFKYDDDEVDAFLHAVEWHSKAEVPGKEKKIQIDIKEWKPFDSRLGV